MGPVERTGIILVQCHRLFADDISLSEKRKEFISLHSKKRWNTPRFLDPLQLLPHRSLRHTNGSGGRDRRIGNWGGELRGTDFGGEAEKPFRPATVNIPRSRLATAFLGGMEKGLWTFSKHDAIGGAGHRSCDPTTLIFLKVLGRVHQETAFFRTKALVFTGIVCAAPSERIWLTALNPGRVGGA